MRKKLKIFMELILAMTLIFGSTLCYASDGDVVEANDYNTFGVTRSQQETKHIGLRISNTDIVVYFDLHYAWEEGYTSWFTGAELTEADVPDGHTVIIYGLTHNADGNSSNITVTIDMEYENIRIDTTDISKIAQNTGMPEWKISRIKDHVFSNEHILDAGVKRFDADPEIADAWYRLTNGTYNQNDIDLLNHEYFESKFESFYKTDYRTAHNKTEESGRIWDPYKENN